MELVGFGGGVGGWGEEMLRRKTNPSQRARAAKVKEKAKPQRIEEEEAARTEALLAAFKDATDVDDVLRSSHSTPALFTSGRTQMTAQLEAKWAAERQELLDGRPVAA